QAAFPAMPPFAALSGRLGLGALDSIGTDDTLLGGEARGRVAGDGNADQLSFQADFHFPSVEVKHQWWALEREMSQDDGEINAPGLLSQFRRVTRVARVDHDRRKQDPPLEGEEPGGLHPRLKRGLAVRGQPAGSVERL